MEDKKTKRVIIDIYDEDGVLTETVFAWPGIGRFLMNSISWRDTPCVMGCVMMFVVAFAVINLIVDILYGFIDPRIRMGSKK